MTWVPRAIVANAAFERATRSMVEVVGNCMMVYGPSAVTFIFTVSHVVLRLCHTTTDSLLCYKWERGTKASVQSEEGCSDRSALLML